ncbi:MAG: DNA mismatch repair protein MutS [Bacillota bacterium]|nr:DNA mismatch repair protein MutS [Bacillota bacterium]
MGLTPMMQQYMQVKEKCKDCILFFRLGDFYEMFFEDAEIASQELELTLTGKDCGLEKRAPMCGVPFHSANVYIGRLISKGYKVAIGEQLEDPAVAKGIVKRDIVKIITPGTFTDSSFLEETKNNYIMSLYIDKNRIGLCLADVSTGEFNCTDGTFDLDLILGEVSKFSPKEILIQDTADCNIITVLNERINTSITKLENSFFSEKATQNLEKQFVNFGEVLFSQELNYAANGLLSYINETQKISLSHIDMIDYYSIVDYLSMDINSRRNLELTENIREKSKKGSLLWVLDKTSTAMGGRQLRRWVEQPLINIDKITARLDAVEELSLNLSLHEDIKDSLKQIYDIERLVGKISSQSVNAKELLFLKNSIEKIPAVKNLIKQFNSTLLNNLYGELDELQDIYAILDDSICNNPSLSIKEGNIIKDGFSEEVDKLRNAKVHGKEWIASLEAQEREATGIKSLKVSYNKVFGYYLEITKSNLSSVPEGRYIRKQTLANCERYITPELKEMEEKILGAEEKLINLEYELFVEIRNTVLVHIDRMKKSAKLLSELDCLSSLATAALENNYCKPEITNDGIISIKNGRHPVVEKVIPNGAFVANDTYLDTKDEQLILITGPNMAGKSTYMRQVALIAVMAQIGGFVPAEEARISISDKIFTRIGASDDLAAGKSTFMVEMWEVSNILKNATQKSLILLDEVGRGTSTYDGLSIAWSVIEYICSNKDMKCKTLFATHYHELTRLEGIIDGLKNYCVAVKKIDDEIVFLRKIIKGAADESYGIEVGKLAGLPEQVISRAKEILFELENQNKDEIALDSIQNKKSDICTSVSEEKAIVVQDDIPKEADANKNSSIKKNKDTKNMQQIGFSDLEKENLLNDIASIDILSMTPMESMNKLYEIIKKAKSL